MKFTKRTFFEVLLILIIIVQGYAIYWLYNFATDKTFSEFNEFMGSFVCMDQLNIFCDFEESEDYESLFSYGEELLEKGYDNDKFVLQGMAKAFYVKGDKEKAAVLVKKAIDGKYYCDFYAPTEKGVLIEEAMSRHILAELYDEIGQPEKALEQFSKSIEIAKKGYGERYNEKVFQRMCAEVSFKQICNNNK